MKRLTLFIVACVATALTGCEEEPLIQYSNLDGPNDAINVRGEVCIETSVSSGVIVGKTYRCKTGERSNIGVVTNGNSNTLTILDLFPAGYGAISDSNIQPRIFDADPGIPGVTHLPVGKYPIAVASSPSGRIVYTLNQQGKSVSVVDLLNLKAATEKLFLPDNPIAFDTASNGDIVTIYADQPLLTIHSGATCSDDSVKSCKITPTEKGRVVLAGFPSSVTLAKSVNNILDVSPKLNNNNNLAYVSYRDKKIISVIALDNAAITASKKTCISGGSSAPCVIDQISLDYSCNDGIDNDNDGKGDKDDPQCFSPYGSERGWKDANFDEPLRGRTDCNDGVDNDSDGKIDKDDPDCIASNGMTESPTSVTQMTTACNDGIDNDGDGKIDAAAPGCYYPSAPSETLPPQIGFDQVSIDPTGTVLWVLDRINNQVLVVDAVQRKLVDTATAKIPSVANYSNLFGIAVPPNAVSLRAANNTDSHVGKDEKRSRITFSAYVGSDNGFVYRIDAFQLSCSSADVADCVQFPHFPIDAKVNKATCTSPKSYTCECLNEEGCSCEKISDFNKLIDERRICKGNVEALVTPIFAIGDDGNGFAEVPTIGQCSTPEMTIKKAIAYSQEHTIESTNPASCDSIIIPQPRAINAPDTVDGSGNLVDASKINLNGVDRTTLNYNVIPYFSPTDDNKISVFQMPLTHALFRDRWTLTFQGELPKTLSSEWYLSKSTKNVSSNGKNVEVSELYVGSDLCASNVQPGDIFELQSSPRSRITACKKYDGEGNTRRYEIVSVNPQKLTIKPLDGPGNLPLPTRDSGCFPSKIAGVVRAKNEWVLERKSEIYFSSQVAQNGTCVTSSIPSESDSRIKTGESYIGQGLSFKIYSGFITPDEGLQYVFDTQSNFKPARFRPGAGTSSNVGDNAGDLPYAIYANDYGKNDLSVFMVTDPSSNLIWTRIGVPTTTKNGAFTRSFYSTLIR